MEDVKKLVIGTAQFGQDYGVTNQTGKVLPSEVQSIFRLARESNISTLDTASGYGDSESLLGDLGVNDFDVITKLPEFNEAKSNFNESIESAMLASLSRLRLSCVDTVLLHRPDQLLGSHGDKIFLALKKIQDKGLAKRIGVSIYSPEFLDNISDKFKFDVVQVPLNIFDQRIISSGWLEKLSNNNVSVMARSVFLQGILLAKLIDLPEYFQPWSKQFDVWADHCLMHRLSPLQASLQFVSQISEVEKIIIGIESEKQLLEVIQALKSPQITNADHLAINDVGLISPIQWSKIKHNGEKNES
jgi:aryl-alcohol dehydrogenase-like predicted oxidoreductase